MCIEDFDLILGLNTRIANRSVLKIHPLISLVPPNGRSFEHSSHPWNHLLFQVICIVISFPFFPPPFNFFFFHIPRLFIIRNKFSPVSFLLSLFNFILDIFLDASISRWPKNCQDVPPDILQAITRRTRRLRKENIRRTTYRPATFYRDSILFISWLML